MSLLFLLGWILVGTVASALLIRYWDTVRDWLNTTAADFVGRYLGYDARSRMQQAVVIVDRFMGKVRQRTTLMTLTPDGTALDEVEVETLYHEHEIDQALLHELSNRRKIQQRFEYKGDM